MLTALSTKLPDPFRQKGAVFNHSQSLSLLAALPVSTLVSMVIVNQTAQWDNFTARYLRTSGTSRISLRASIQRLYMYAAAAKSLHSCPALCNPIEGSPLSSSVPEILHARILEWVAISFSNARKWKVKVNLLSHAQLLVTPWTAAYQAPPSMGFSRKEYRMIYT